MAGERHRKTLGDYFTLQRGTTYKSRLLGQPGPVLLGLATIQRNGGFRTDSLRTYGGESPAKLLVHPGDLYVSLKDVTQSADLLGAVARLPIDHPPGRLTQDTVKLEPKGTNVPLEYLYWLLRSPQYRSYCGAHATGTTNLGLAREDFFAFPAPEPTPIQHKFVETLGTLDDKIELNRRMNETLEAMARALFKSWFVDFDPVHAKADGRDPGLPKSLADLFPDSFEDSDLGEIPKGWRSGRLNEVTGFLGGYAFKSKDWVEQGVPVVKIGSVKPGIVDLSATSFVRQEVAEEVPRYRLSAGDLLIGMTGYVGEVGLVPPTDNPPLLNQRVGKFVLEKPGTSILAFLYCLTRQPEFKAQVETKSHGTAQANVSAEGILSIQIVVPPKTLRDEFNRIIQPVLDRILANHAESFNLAVQRDTLLPKLISGELWIKAPTAYETGRAR